MNLAIQSSSMIVRSMRLCMCMSGRGLDPPLRRLDRGRLRLRLRGVRARVPTIAEAELAGVAFDVAELDVGDEVYDGCGGDAEKFEGVLVCGLEGQAARYEGASSILQL
jgi:hypothetical protein